jgi:hypothetical protein
MKEMPLPLTVWAIKATGLPEPSGRRARASTRAGKVVAVEFAGVPAEGGPFVAEGGEGHDFVAAAGGLPFVVIDDDHEAFDFLSGGEEGGFPDAAFVAFAVAEADEDAPGVSVRRRAARAMPRRPRPRQAVSEGAGGEFDAGGAVGGGLFGEGRTVPGEGRQPVAGEEAAFGEDGVEGGGGVTLA